MAILPPCRDHEERIQDIERLMEDVVSTMAALVDALKDNHANITGLQEIQAINTNKYTPGDSFPGDNSYFR